MDRQQRVVDVTPTNLSAESPRSHVIAFGCRAGDRSRGHHCLHLRCEDHGSGVRYHRLTRLISTEHPVVNLVADTLPACSTDIAQK
jgi:hypothetical protein